jgi:glutamine amidotransferase
MSVRQSLHEIGLRCRVSSEPAILGACGLLLLPGVGAFRPAIEAVRERNLDEFLSQQVSHGVPVLGICLGMQLLADISDEDGPTAGLGLIPGRVVSLPAPRWHTGWNTIEQVTDDPLFSSSHGQAFFFNQFHGRT